MNPDGIMTADEFMEIMGISPTKAQKAILDEVYAEASEHDPWPGAIGKLYSRSDHAHDDGSSHYGKHSLHRVSLDKIKTTTGEVAGKCACGEEVVIEFLPGVAEVLAGRRLLAGVAATKTPEGCKALLDELLKHRDRVERSMRALEQIAELMDLARDTLIGRILGPDFYEVEEL